MTVRRADDFILNLISYMFHELESWMEDHGYLNVFVSAEELEWGSLYYSDERTDMDTLIKKVRECLCRITEID